MTEKQKKIINHYRGKLNITTKGELFVLRHILKRDWDRDIILLNIDMIQYNHPTCLNLVLVKCSTRNSSYTFSVPHLGGTGWITNNIKQQKTYISNQLYDKIDT